jgi:electron transfer flavoprotein alpha subunit
VILVLCEVDPVTGEVDEVSLEALAVARSLSAAGGGVAVRAVVVGPVPDPGAVAATLGRHGVGEVRHAVGDGVSAFGGAAWAAAFETVRQATGSVACLAGGTPRGNEVMAHLAARLDVAMAANVVSFDGLSPLTVHRQVAGGAALEEMRLAARPAVLTVAGHAWRAEPTGAGPADWVETTPDLSPADLVARVVRTTDPVPDESGTLRSARVVVGAGRGAGGPDGFGAVTELAELLGGTVGVTRVVTSLGWRPHHEQVGQTGSRISPELYVACGISGAIQHWAGCASSGSILAVNTDPEAPMMTRATYAVVGDMHEVVPAIVEEIRRRG